MGGAEDAVAVRLFGIPSLNGQGDGFFPIKGFILASALLIAPRRQLTRQAAASLLWEEADQKRALGNLRQLLLRLNKFNANGQALFEVNSDMLKAGPGLENSDLVLFMKAATSHDSAEMGRALTLFSGDFLQGVEVEGEEIHLWLLGERQRLRDQYFTILNEFLEDLTRFGNRRVAEIARYGQAALALEPEREETHRAIISAYARIGVFDAAERAMEALERQCMLEGRAPDAQTLALKRRLRSQANVRDGAVDAVLPEKVHATHKPRIAFLKPQALNGAVVDFLLVAFVEDVAASLARYRTFSVVAPYSSFSIAQMGDDPAVKTLKADYVVSARVYDAARLSFMLTHAQNHEILWSVDVALNERELHNAFRLLTKQVAMALADQIERLQVQPERSQNAAAYRHLLEGQHLINGGCDLPASRKARSNFRKAVELDATMSVARARIAQTLQLEWLMLGSNDPHLLQRAKAEADAAMELDPASGIGHWMAAVIALHQRDFDASAEKFYEAEALSPNSADLILQHSDALSHFGEAERAWEKFEYAIDLNPLPPDLYWWTGACIAFKLQDYGGAIDLCGRMKNDEPVLRVLTASHAMNGDIDQARHYVERLKSVYPNVTAKDISNISPDKDQRSNQVIFEALQRAGLK